MNLFTFDIFNIKHLIFYVKLFLTIFFLMQVTSDFVVEVEGKRIYVHKRILGIRSQHFREKFQFDQTENNKR